MHQDVVLKFGLKKGDVLSEDQIKEIILYEQKNKAKERALNLLSYRDRSENELRTRLENAGFDHATIDSVTEDLKRLQLIDDQRFALSFARSKILSRPSGEFLLERELKQKGIDPDLRIQTLEKIFREFDQYKLAAGLAKRKKAQLKSVDEGKAKKRVNDLLMRRGFGWGIISQIFDHWENLEQEDD